MKKLNLDWDKIKKQFKLLLKRIKLFLKTTTGKIVAIVAAAVLVALILTIALNSSKDERTVLFSSVNTQEVTNMYTSLKMAGADVQINNDGALTVPTTELSIWAFHIGTEGYATPGYGLAAENSGMTQTESERETWDLRQSQDRLQETLKVLSGVSNAVVTLDLPETSNYIWEQTGSNKEASASILLTLSSNTILTGEQVTSIKNFVAAQFNNMVPSNVTVLNSKTMLELHGIVENSNIITYEQNFELERIIQEQIEGNITRLLSQRYGADGVVATARVTINYDKMITEQLELAKGPDGEGFVTDKTVEGLVTGYDNVGGIVGEEDNTDTPTYPYGAYEAEDAVHFYSHAEFDYSYTKTQVERGQAVLERATVSVLVNDPNFNETTRDDLISLISTSADIPVELIFVSSFTPPTVDSSDSFADQLARFFDILATIPAWVFITLGISLFLIIALIVSAIRKMRKKKAERKMVADEAALAAQREIEDHKQKLIDDAKASEDPAGDAIINEIRGFADQNPEIAASLIRSWLKECEN